MCRCVAVAVAVCVCQRDGIIHIWTRVYWRGYFIATNLPLYIADIYVKVKKKRERTATGNPRCRKHNRIPACSTVGIYIQYVHGCVLYINIYIFLVFPSSLFRLGLLLVGSFVRTGHFSSVISINRPYLTLHRPRVCVCVVRAVLL